MADPRSERAEFSPERADFRSLRGGDIQINKRTDEQTKVPLCFTELCSLRGRCPKSACNWKMLRVEGPRDRHGHPWPKRKKKKQCVKPVNATLVVFVVLFCNRQRSWTYISQQDHGKKIISTSNVRWKHHLPLMTKESYNDEVDFHLNEVKVL